MQIYLIFKTIGNYSNERTDELISICDTLESCNKIIDESISYVLSNMYGYNIEEDIVHESMNKDNRFTYIGKRKDCKYELYENSYGGYIIEIVDDDNINKIIT